MKLGVILILVLSSLALAAQASPDGINRQGQTDAYFSSEFTTDRIVASIIGESCDDAVFRLTVENADSEQLFNRQIPLQRIYPCDVFDRDPDEGLRSCTRIVNYALGLRAAGSIPCGAEPTDCSKFPFLARLRKMHGQVLCFWTGSESIDCVAFDAVTETVVNVRSREDGGLDTVP